MHAALEAASVDSGDEVIVPPLTMSSTTFAVLQCGATPIFADVDKNTFQIDPKDIAKKDYYFYKSNYNCCAIWTFTRYETNNGIGKAK